MRFIQVEIQDPSGKPLPGYSQKECDPLYGDEISHLVTWKEKADVAELASKTVQLHFIMNEADLFSLRFH